MSYLEDYIERGIRNGLDVSLLTKEEWDETQLYSIARGIEDDLDVNVYAKKELDFRQMEEVRFRLLWEKIGWWS